MSEQKNNDFPKKPLNNYAKYSGMAIKMIVIIVGATLGGVELDKYLQFKFPIFTLALSLAGVFLAIYYFIKDFIRK